MPTKKLKRRTVAKKLKQQPKIELRSGQREQRSFGQRLEVRTTADGRKQLSGVAVVFNSRSENLGGFVEVVSSTALNRTLTENPDIFLLREHDSSKVLGRTTADTLQLSITSRGLEFVATLPKSDIGDDTYEAVRLGNVDACSFGFTVPDGGDTWQQLPDGAILRTLLDINVHEISIVTWPAYSATTVDVRSCPVALRSKLTRSEDDDNDDDSECDPDSPDFDPDADCPDEEDEEDEEDEDRCDCRCAECRDNRCEQCSATDCDSDLCEDCPTQQRAAHMSLLMRRLR